jgi:hypothetical protein
MPPGRLIEERGRRAWRGAEMSTFQNDEDDDREKMRPMMRSPIEGV